MTRREERAKISEPMDEEAMVADGRKVDGGWDPVEAVGGEVKTSARSPLQKRGIGQRQRNSIHFDVGAAGYRTVNSGS